MKPLVLVTYRDRITHLNVFTLYMQRYYPHLRIAILEQADNGPWNKGLLYNVGYKELAQDYDYIIQHDIDWVPVVGKVDYGYCDTPCMIGGEASQFGYRNIYPQFFGGVVVMSKEHYELTNGHSNQFTGYGGEDDLQYRSFISKGIIPRIKMGRFECFEHPRLKETLQYQHNLRILEAGRDFNEGLSTAKYQVVSRQDHKECIHLRINTIVR